ncbi:transmembrane protein, putative [Bodo saltans]|uniref:Transmembrane protein, putative n=1 Tax=Bodo saltans TaxID=75058 RepID=A0A0S4JMP4_BODSA|nr:transmembrane protein, putative [Bodo saltans]|eukprot:CUG92742.1 transmembrane protein, putative [Bodo saltans]
MSLEYFASQKGAEMPSPSPSPTSGVSKIHVWMDLRCKYVVSAATAVVGFSQTPMNGESFVVPFVIGMSVVSVLIGKVLKKILRQARPGTARKDDHGMPSSHGLALAYLSWAAMLGLVTLRLAAVNSAHDGALWSSSLIPGVIALALGVYWSALRVVLGDHSLAQVLVGYGIGWASCVAVFVGNYYGMVLDLEHLGGRVDAVTTPTQRWAATRVAATGCSIMFVMIWKKWKKKDVIVVQRQEERNEALTTK